MQGETSQSENLYSTLDSGPLMPCQCDETRPKCRRCIGAGVECPGYNQPRKFIDQGAMLRRRYAPYGSSTTTSGTETRAENVDNEISDPVRGYSLSHHITVQVTRTTPPRYSPTHRRVNNTSSMQTENMNEQVDPDIELASKGTSLENDQQQPSPLRRLPYSELNGSSILSDEGSRSTQAISDSSSIDARNSIALEIQRTPKQMKSTGRSLPFSPGAFPHQREKDHLENMSFEPRPETVKGASFIIRHFSHAIGPWYVCLTTLSFIVAHGNRLDMSDSDRFFSVHVPIRASDNKALKYSMAAITAKHLGRTKGTGLDNQGGMIPILASKYADSDTSQIDWFLEGENYYSIAIAEINRLISENSPNLNSNASIPLIQRVSLWLSSNPTKNRLDILAETTPDILFLRKLEDLLATVVLLTTYISMDINAEEWSR